MPAPGSSAAVPPLADQLARDRFRDEWDQNFAVSANAGSGKTTAISERLAAMALTPRGAELLRRTAVVTFTRKAAAQIGQRARQVLLRRLGEDGRKDFTALDHLERAFFGTIHSFCLLLAQRHGQTLGLNLNPTVVSEEDDEALWEEFLEQDAMQFTALAPAQVDAFLRHAPLESIFPLARRLDLAAARRLVARPVAAAPAEPAAAVLQEILAAATRAGKSAATLKRNQENARRWVQRFRDEKDFLPLPRPEGSAANIKELYARLFQPVKAWLAEAGAVMAAELARRFRDWRFDRGIQTYADQIEAALAVLHDEAMLEKIRAENWRVILDEAQDTDPQQFAVLVEVTRPAGAPIGSWPGRGPPPRPGHFCLVGDGQQAIYSTRADIRNFQAHLEAFETGLGGERLRFTVTFRAPQRAVALLNRSLPDAFGPKRPHNFGVSVAAGAPPKLLQVPYEPLVAGPGNLVGAAGVLLLEPAGEGTRKVEARLAAEVRALARRLAAEGPGAVGAASWGEICVLAPRNDWLITARKEFEAAGLRIALQMRRNRNADNPVYAWLSGLLAAVCDPANRFEWCGVWREVFGVSDAAIASALRASSGLTWDEPETWPEDLGGAMATLRPFVERVDAEAAPLGRFVQDLVDATGLTPRAEQIDPSGGLAAELRRLLLQAAERGRDGLGPREWLQELLETREAGRPAGKPADEAINLLTSFSAKGLEWPVVIPIGLWRELRPPPETGLRLVPGTEAAPAVYFDHDSVPPETREARERERVRELVRLLYVTLTRARRALVLPWPQGAEARPGSLAELWGVAMVELTPWEAAPVEFHPGSGPVAADAAEATVAREKSPAVAYPARILPHQLSHQPDAPRVVRHESGGEEPRPAAKDDPIEYGLWWHGTMEFLPWSGTVEAVDGHLERALAEADVLGFEFGQRARREVELLRGSEVWKELRSGRWQVATELSVLAPLGPQGWVDGVIDLVARDAAADELWVIDWKTNRRRTGEALEAFLRRLLEEYRPQLESYGECLARFFPTASVRLAIYGTNAGGWKACREGAG